MNTQSNSALNKRKRYIDLTPSQLHNRLQNRGLPLADILRIKENIAFKKAIRTNNRREQTIMRKPWAELIAPLSQEIRLAKVTLAYHKKRPKNWELEDFFDSYVKLLEKVRNELNKHKAKPIKTPKQMKPDAESWVDWVSEKTVNIFRLTYAAIEIPKQVKRRDIFNPNPEPKPSKTRVALSISIETDLAGYKRELMNAVSPEMKAHYQEMVDLYTIAERRLARLGARKRVPKDAYGLFSTKELHIHSTKINNIKEGITE